MRSWLIFFVSFVTFASSLEAKDAVTIEVKDAGFEAPSSSKSVSSKSVWRHSQHAGVKAYEVTRDADVFTEGKQSLRITRIADQVYGAVKQLIVDPQPGKYRYGAKLRSKDVDGRGWMTYIRVYRATGEWDAYFSEPLLATVGWRDTEIKFVVPGDATSIELGLSLRGGGTGWADAIRLERLATE
jgi:hypothetical protein